MRVSLQRRDKLLARAQIATGLGILAFWLLFFTVGLAPENAPACYFAFEHAFPLPDCVLALGLLVAGILQVNGQAWARVLSLACAGGLIFLGLVDFGFNLPNGVYTSSVADGLMAAAINLWCVALGVALTVAPDPSMQTSGNSQPASGLPIGEANAMVGNRTRATEVVLVTGCSSGIGKAICDQLGKSNVRVYGGSRSACAPEGWTHLKMDVTDEASVQGVIDEIVRREGRIDAIVSCAGVSLAGPVEDTTIGEAKQHFDTNFFGTVRVIRAVLPVMRRQASGKIIVIGSIGGLIGLPYLGHYSASKFALDGLIEAMRTEIEPFGIQATVIHPGDFNTALGANRVYCGNTNAQSPYHQTFVKTRDFYAASEAKAPAPTAVARKVQKVLELPRLPVWMLVGSPLEILGVWGKYMLPSRGFEYLFRKAYGP